MNELIESAGIIIASQQLAAKDVQNESMEIYGKLIDANILAFSVIGSAALRMHGQKGKLDVNGAKRESLLAAFIMGMNLCQDAITQGYYMQAGALIRQELEILAALQEIKLGSRSDKRTPNVSNLEWDLNKSYGALSDIAHASVANVVLDFTKCLETGSDDTAAFRLYPQLRANISRQMYGLHTVLIIQVAYHIHESHLVMHNSGLTKLEMERLEEAKMYLVEEKSLELIET